MMKNIIHVMISYRCNLEVLTICRQEVVVGTHVIIPLMPGV